MANHARQVLDNANRVIDDIRPQVVQISTKPVEIAKSGRAQVERLGDVLFEASRRAQERLAQIDQSVRTRSNKWRTIATL